MRIGTNQDHDFEQIKMVLLIGAFFVALLALDPSWGVTLEGLQEPILSLKNDIFGGWMMVVKIAAAAMGIVLSAFKGSLTPFGIGAGLCLGIHLYDEYLNIVVQSALI